VDWKTRGFCRLISGGPKSQSSISCSAPSEHLVLFFNPRFFPQGLPVDHSPTAVQLSHDSRDKTRVAYHQSLAVSVNFGLWTRAERRTQCRRRRGRRIIRVLDYQAKENGATFAQIKLLLTRGVKMFEVRSRILVSVTSSYPRFRPQKLACCFYNASLSPQIPPQVVPRDLSSNLVCD
jgi:hypothetical protein